MKIAQETKGIYPTGKEVLSSLISIEDELSLFEQGLPDPDPRISHSLMGV